MAEEVYTLREGSSISSEKQGRACRDSLRVRLDGRT